MSARLVPIGPVPDAWLVSGSMRAYRKSDAGQVAEAALELATKMPELVYRNPGKVEQAWQQMRAEGPRSWSSSAATNWSFRPPRRRNGSTPSTGTDRKPRSPGGPPADRRTSPAWTCPRSASAELADADTIGVIYDEIDGLNFYNEYGMLRDLFTDPALTSDKGHVDALRGYLRAETIGPLPFRRLATAHPQTVDAVFQKILREPHFTWAEHGEALLRRRKPWYYEHEPRPDRTVIGARLSELIGR